MQHEKETLCRYRLERAKEDLEAARVKHSSVIAHFNQYYVHTGEFERGIYKIIDGAYRIREKCDYSDFFLASKEESAIQIEHADAFIKTVEEYISKKEEEKRKMAEDFPDKE